MSKKLILTADEYCCKKHGEHCHYIESSIEGYEGKWCTLCALEKLEELGVNRVKKMEEREEKETESR